MTAEEKHRHRERARAKTPNGLLLLRYRKLCHRCREKGWTPNFTREDFIAWSMQNAWFNMLYVRWVASGFDKWKSPSIDRVDPSRPYEVGNLQWMTWRQNWEKGHKEHKKP